MKILIIKYDNGFAVTATDEVENAQGQRLERKRKWVIEEHAEQPALDHLINKLKEIFA